jgi:hypothetical protein
MDSKFSIKYIKKPIISNRKPEFFSRALDAVSNGLNWTYAFYVIFSVTVYILRKMFGSEFMTESNINKLFLATKISLIENERAVFRNFFHSIVLTFLITLNTLASRFKSIPLFICHYIFTTIIGIDYLIGVFGFSNVAISKIFYYINIISSIIFTIYAAYYYTLCIGYFKYNLEDYPIASIIHEIKLRTDMLKISYNNFLINFKVNKYFPGLLYKKHDYYFTTAQRQENNNCEEEYYDQVDELSHRANENNKGFNNSKYMNNSNSYEYHSKSTFDNEYEPLK